MTTAAGATRTPHDHGALGDRAPLRRHAAQATALVGAGLLVAAVFASWSIDGRRGLHTALLAATPTHLTVGLAAIALAIVAAGGALAGDRGWPRLVAGIGAGALVLSHLASWAGTSVPAGVALATTAAVVELVSAALATATPALTRLPNRPRAGSRRDASAIAPGPQEQPPGAAADDGEGGQDR